MADGKGDQAKDAISMLMWVALQPCFAILLLTGIVHMGMVRGTLTPLPFFSNRVFGW